MVESLLYFSKIRIDLHDENVLVIEAGSNRENMSGTVVKAYVDNKEIPVKTIVRTSSNIKFLYKSVNPSYDTEYDFLIDLNEGVGNVKLEIQKDGILDKPIIYTVTQKAILRMQKRVEYYIDNFSYNDGVLLLLGWAVGENPVDIKILDSKKRPLKTTDKRYLRTDIMGLFLKGETCFEAGFEVSADVSGNKIVYVEFSEKGRKSIKRFRVKDLKAGRMTTNLERAKKVFVYLDHYGYKKMFRKVYKKLKHIDGNDYDQWQKMHKLSAKQLNMQKNTEFEYRPLMSIIVPVYRPKPEHLKKMIESVREQTYSNWELCLADGSGDGYSMEMVVRAFNDSRIKYKFLESNQGISGNTNEALNMTTGDYIVLGDHDDTYTPDALYESVKAINENRDIELIYSDEDKIDDSTGKYFQPHFKPDMNIDMLRCNNYICHMFVFRRDIYKKIGAFNSEFDGSQDYDFILRCVENSKVIKHIPKVLYHWRFHDNSTAKNPDSKSYAFVAGKNALISHFERVGIRAEVEDGIAPGCYKVTYPLVAEPLVSVIIPNKDHSDDLRKCIESLMKKSSYRNFEVIVVENNSTDPKTFEYYKELEDSYSNVKVVTWEKEFNYSAINNYGVSHAEGTYYLLLNNDTELITENVIGQLLGFCQREDVGIVGAELFYEDDTIQHAGVIVGLGGVAGHCFVGESRDFPGYFVRAVIPQDLSAVTAACMMVKKSVYEKVGGFSEDLAVAYNDVDFCLKVRKAGYLVVYNPYAKLYHYESKSRGMEDSPEKIERFNQEKDLFVERWHDIIDNGDPYYNVNLTLKKSDFSLWEI